RLAVDDRIRFAEQPPPLRVADNRVLGPGFLGHQRRDFTGERALALPVEILRGDADVRVARRFGNGVQRGERRCNRDLDLVEILHRQLQLLDEHHRLGDGLEHLPVAGDEWYAGAHDFSASAATPGSVSPPRNSSDAPPPVEMCVILSATPALFTAAIESPPPMIVVPSTPATARATPLVPAANASISNTPIGPFQTTVFAPAIAAAYALIVAGPMSTP